MRQMIGWLAVAGMVLSACTSTTAPPGPRGTVTAPAEIAAAPEPTATPEPNVILMWARGGLPPHVAERAAELPGVVSALHVRSDTVALVGSAAADGTPVDDLEAGWMIPVEAMAITPRRAAATLPPGPARSAFGDLRPGKVLLSEGAAARRGLGPGATVDLEGRPGLEVAAVVPDDVVGRDELVLHRRDGDAAGLAPEGSVRLVHDGSNVGDLAEQLAALAPEGTAVRVVGAREGEEPERAPLVLGLPEVKERFGEFVFRDDDADREIRVEPAWIREHIVVEEVPILGRVRCHRAIMEDLRAALQAVVDQGMTSSIDPANYGGCYHARRIGTISNGLSRHSWGIAIDINVDFREPGFGPPPEPAVVEAFAAHGFRWGGLFLSPDNHHFEWVGEVATEEPPPSATGRTAVVADSDDT